MVASRKYERLIYLVFTLPAVLAFFLVVIMPFMIGIGYSFVEWDGIALNPMTFAGLDNYKRIFMAWTTTNVSSVMRDSLQVLYIRLSLRSWRL